MAQHRRVQSDRSPRSIARPVARPKNRRSERKPARSLPFAKVRPTTAQAGGLTVVAAQLPALHAVAVSVRLRTGPRYEGTSNNGISHFLEHMLYRGTARYPSANSQAAAFERLGSSLAAATYVDHGMLGVVVPPENLRQALALLGEVYRAPLLGGIEIERGIVEEEILDLLDDEGNPIDTDVLVRALCFEEHALGMPITGSIEKLKGFDRRKLRRHHERHYTARGTVIAIAGPIDPDRVIATAASSFSGLPEGDLEAPLPPPPQFEPRFEYRDRNDSKTALRLAFRAPGDGHPDEPAVELLLRTLDDGMSTRLYEHICDERGLCYDVSANYESYADQGLFDIAAETAHQRAGRVLDELFDVVRRLRDEGPTQAELAKATTRLRWSLTEVLDHPAEVADFHALALLTRGPRTLLARFEQLEGVTREQVRSAAQRVFRRENLSVVAVGELPGRTERALERRVKSFS
jgi:predicted Zn-dependent peptidase